MESATLPPGFRTELREPPEPAVIAALSAGAGRTGAGAFLPTDETLDQVQGAIDADRVSWTRCEAWLRHPDERVPLALLGAGPKSPLFRFKDARAEAELVQRLLDGVADTWSPLHQALLSGQFRGMNTAWATPLRERIEKRIAEISDPAALRAVVVTFDAPELWHVIARYAPALDEALVRELTERSGGDLIPILSPHPAFGPEYAHVIEDWIVRRFEAIDGPLDEGRRGRLTARAAFLHKKKFPLPQLVELVERRFAEAGQGPEAETRARWVVWLAALLAPELSLDAQVELLRRRDDIQTANNALPRIERPEFWERVAAEPGTDDILKSFIHGAQVATANANFDDDPGFSIRAAALQRVQSMSRFKAEMLQERAGLRRRLIAREGLDIEVLGWLTEIAADDPEDREAFGVRLESMLVETEGRERLFAHMRKAARQPFVELAAAALGTERLTRALESLGEDAQTTAWALWRAVAALRRPDVAAAWLDLPPPASTDLRKAVATNPDCVTHPRVREILATSPSPDIIRALLPSSSGEELRTIVERLTRLCGPEDLVPLLEMPTERLGALEPRALAPLLSLPDVELRERAIRLASRLGDAEASAAE